jgi:hypothetical protein
VVVKKITYVYLSLEIKDYIAEIEDLKKAVRENIDAILDYAQKQDPFIKELAQDIQFAIQQVEEMIAI